MEEVVNINSGTQNFACVEAVGHIFQARFEAIGMSTERIDGMAMGGANDHTVNETGDLESLRMQAQRAALLIYRLVQDRF